MLLFADDVIIHIENPKESTTKLLEIIGEQPQPKMLQIATVLI